uniref:BZIP domain-containing protein n=1 Tax=Anisakis simplex TaxID=6269 RepID=A0A0M3J0Y8_ANISI
LNRMVKDGMTEENSISLANIEKFATHVSECMHPVRRKRSPKTTEQQDQNDCVEKQQMHDTESGDSVRHIGDGGDDGCSKSIGEFIANRMFSAKRHKNRSAWKRKTKKHKADVEQLHVLALIVQKCWVDLAVARNDKASLSRLWEWSVQNKLEASLLESRRLKNIFATKIGRATSKE